MQLLLMLHCNYSGQKVLREGIIIWSHPRLDMCSC